VLFWLGVVFALVFFWVLHFFVTFGDSPLLPREWGHAWRIYNKNDGDILFSLPGDNWGQVVVFVMPKDLREKLERQGLGYLNSFDPQDTVGWAPTPMTQSRFWDSQGRCNVSSCVQRCRCPGISLFTSNYSCLRLARRVETMANDALLGTGAYYWNGFDKLILLVPQKNRIVVAHRK